MKVGIGYTKTNKVGHIICDRFLNGVNLNPNDEAFPIKTVSDINKCDCIVQLCPYNPDHAGAKSGDLKLRHEIHKFATERSIPILLIDVGYFKNKRISNDEDRYQSVGFGGIKGLGHYHNENSPNDRWGKLDISLKPWNQGGEYILILGQNPDGISVRHLNVVKWYKGLVEIFTKVGHKVAYRAHPNRPQIKLDNTIWLDPKQPIEKHLSNAKCAISRTTNACTDAIINGVPHITPDPISVSFPVSSHSIDLDELIRPDREQWCYNMAYAQWHTKEMETGECWNHFRTYLQARA